MQKFNFQPFLGERPYVCEFCEKRFSDASTLHVHKRLHTNENPYVCHLCGRRTKQASNLRSHYKHFHKNNDITGRQIRLNSRIFNRFTQSELDAQLLENGDLMVLLERGLHEHDREEQEKNCQIEQALKESIVATAVETQPTATGIRDGILTEINLSKFALESADFGRRLFCDNKIFFGESLQIFGNVEHFSNEKKEQ